MDVQERLQELLRSGAGTPEAAEIAARAAELLAAYLRLEREVDSLLGRESQENNGEGGSGHGLAQMTLHDAAEAVLKEAGSPLHVRELGRRIKAGGWTHPRSRHARPEQINFQLAARLPRLPDRFVRVAPNTFGLTSWRAESRRSRRNPRFSLFDGPGQPIGRRIGETSDVPIETQQWR